MNAPLPWFRAYTEMIDDEKLRLLAFEDRWHFVALLCLKGQGVLEDAGPLLMRKVAVKMGLDTRTLEDVIRRLAEVGLVDQNTMQPLNWDTRQMRSDTDPTAAERKRRQRAKAKTGAGSSDVTDESRVTGHDVTRTDIDIDTDKDKEEVVEELVVVGGGHAADDATPAASPKQSGRPKAKTATRLPGGWVLPKAWGDWALQDRSDLTADDVRKEAEVFADYWHAKAGADAKKLDWQATWRNWVRRCDGPKPLARTAFGGGAQVNKQEALEQRNRAVAAAWVPPEMRAAQSSNRTGSY
ncbi:hypothetical protein G7048_22685 [Diaphorobacter sp. HDW4B]|uniref:hypothetical protein n=1 Tax=Diaphorobacter sp. HDW4B TaxID=2714925 RepID=UPI00140C5A60|nr:hypothetical protein [Diaphorobacter sp. HDW4B]QIL72908.1 hypothetical protein G7048_22685 [Diaphorobacter sp. HDW4B]